MMKLFSKKDPELEALDKEYNKVRQAISRAKKVGLKSVVEKLEEQRRSLLNRRNALKKLHTR